MVKEPYDGEERAALNEGDEATTVLPATVITTSTKGLHWKKKILKIPIVEEQCLMAL